MESEAYLEPSQTSTTELYLLKQFTAKSWVLNTPLISFTPPDYFLRENTTKLPVLLNAKLICPPQTSYKKSNQITLTIVNNFQLFCPWKSLFLKRGRKIEKYAFHSNLKQEGLCPVQSAPSLAAPHNTSQSVCL